MEDDGVATGGSERVVRGVDPPASRKAATTWARARARRDGGPDDLSADDTLSGVERRFVRRLDRATGRGAPAGRPGPD
ncbi:hypothetical protein UB45_07010 [Terrabacter sp. 28]|nr:hypothetical protein UB45_07010 [Terrabacter sp. 28]